MLRTFASPRLPALVPSSSPCMFPLCRGRGRAFSPKGAIEQQKVMEWGRVGTGVGTLEVVRFGPEGAVAVCESGQGQSSHTSSSNARKSVVSVGPLEATGTSYADGCRECKERGCPEGSLAARSCHVEWSTGRYIRCRMARI